MKLLVMTMRYCQRMVGGYDPFFNHLINYVLLLFEHNVFLAFLEVVPIYAYDSTYNPDKQWWISITHLFS